MMRMDQNIRNAIREFLSQEILLDETAEIKSDINLFQSGILDSQGLVILVGFLEREFNIEIGAEDLAGNSLTTISNIEDLIIKRHS